MIKRKTEIIAYSSFSLLPSVFIKADVWILVCVFMFNAWLVEVRPLTLTLFSSPFFLSSSRSGHREAKISNFSLPQMDCCDFFWLFPKYLSSPRAIWVLLIWTLKEQRVSWPPMLTGKQRAWPKIHPLLFWIPPNPRTDVGRTRPSKSNLFSVGFFLPFLLYKHTMWVRN